MHRIAFVVFLVLVGLLFVLAWGFDYLAPGIIFQCGTIQASGAYSLNQSIVGATEGIFGPLNPMSCIRINASNVVLDCKGFSISNTGIPPVFNSTGILITPTRTNVTIKNCTISDYSANGIRVLSASNNSFFDNEILHNSIGILVETNSNSNSLFRNQIHDNFVDGITIRNSNNNRLINNTAFNHNSNPLNVSSNGILLFNSNFTTLVNNTVHGNTRGIALTSSNSNILTNNTLYNNQNNGIKLEQSSSNNRLVHNFAYQNQLGFSLELSDSNILINNTADNNLIIGFEDRNSAFNNYSSNGAFNNSLVGYAIDNSISTILYGNFALENNPNDLVLDLKTRNPAPRNETPFGIQLGGFLFVGASNSIVKNNFAYKNHQHGMGFIFGAYANNMTNNTVEGNSIYGIYLDSADNNKFVNNTIKNQADDNCSDFTDSELGIYMTNSSGTILEGDHYYNNTCYTFVGKDLIDPNNDIRVFANSRSISYNLSGEIFDNPNGDKKNYTVLDLSDSLDTAASPKFAEIRWFPEWIIEQLGLPANHNSFEGKSIIIASDDTIDAAKWTWLESEVSSYNESSFGLWEFNGSAFVDKQATLNTSANTLNISKFKPSSLYLILNVVPAVTGCANSSQCTNGHICNASIGGPLGQCQPCVTDFNCTSDPVYGPNFVCAAGSCIIPQCTEDANCTSVNSPVCNLTTYQCGPCNTPGPSQCTHIPQQLNLVCNVANGHCEQAECLSDSNCDYPAPNCNLTTYLCYGCTGDNDCSRFNEPPFVYPYCRVSNGNCVRCLPGSGNTQCAQGWICPNYDCAQCTLATDCDGEYGVGSVCFQSNTNTCGNCTQDTGGNSMCASQYPGVLPWCGPSNKCVACLSDSNCPSSAPVCSNNVCGPCTNNTVCSENHQGTICSVGQCVVPECITDQECANTQPFEPACEGNVCFKCGFGTTEGAPDFYCANYFFNSTTHQGTPACNSTAHQCVQCISDSYCQQYFYPTPGLPDCKTQTQSCVQCTSNATCAELFSSTPFCKTNTNTCVECLTSATCPKDKPFCSNNVCIKGQPPSSGGGGGGGCFGSIMAEFTPGCQNNEIVVKAASTPIVGTSVNVYKNDVQIASGSTDSNGTFNFSSTEGNVQIYVSSYNRGGCSYSVPGGFFTKTLKTTSECLPSGCTRDSDCPTNYVCSNNKCSYVAPPPPPPPPTQPPECTIDAECATYMFCSGGSCAPVTGTCGYVENHTWNSYDCCLDSDCAPGNICADHKCASVQYDLTATGGFVGETGTASASVGGLPFNGQLRITKPDSTWELVPVTDGQLSILLDQEGDYSIDLLVNGKLVKSVVIQSLLKPPMPPAEGPSFFDVLAQPGMLLILLIVLGAGAFLIYRFFFAGEKPKKK